MKIRLTTAILAISAVLSVASCGNKQEATVDRTDDRKEATANDEQPAVAQVDNEQVIEMFAGNESAILTLENDALIRPGMEVDKPVILDFNATWCGPCQQFHPVFDETAKKYSDEVYFASIDTDANPLTAEAFGIQSIPTVVVIVPGQPEKFYVGTEDIMPIDKFDAIVSKVIADFKASK